MSERVFLDWCLSCSFCAIAGSTFLKVLSVGELDHRRPESHASVWLSRSSRNLLIASEKLARLRVSLSFPGITDARTESRRASSRQVGHNFRFVCMGVTIPARNSRPGQFRRPYRWLILRIGAWHSWRAETSLGFDRVMVFPQGRFSGEAMRALRASPMLSAVNTELVDCQTGAGVKGHELLRPAIMSFGGFPLFMRRRAEEASANFALDLLLGKPCLIVTHHQFFEDGLKPLRAAVDRLNALQPDLVWTNLERGILSTYSVCSSVQ